MRRHVVLLWLTCFALMVGGAIGTHFLDRVLAQNRKPSPEPSLWIREGKPPTVILSYDAEKCGLGGSDDACVYVNVWLKGGGVVVVNRHTGATKRCEGTYATDTYGCRP